MFVLHIILYIALYSVITNICISNHLQNYVCKLSKILGVLNIEPLVYFFTNPFDIVTTEFRSRLFNILSNKTNLTNQDPYTLILALNFQCDKEELLLVHKLFYCPFLSIVSSINGQCKTFSKTRFKNRINSQL